MDDNARIAEAFVRAVDPVLESAVSAFMAGGDFILPMEDDWASPSVKLRRLHDELQDAYSKRKPTGYVAVIAAAVRLEAVILYETLKRGYKC